MFFEKPLPFIENFLNALDDAIGEYKPGARLTRIQKGWLAFCIMGILLTNSVCWARFERSGMGHYSQAAISWMFRQSKIPWELLLHMSVKVILITFGIIEGILATDDSGKKRSKSVRKIARVHKIKDKSTGGFFIGQTIVFLVLVTPQITFPVGFAFHEPDPELSKWHKENEKLKKQGVPPKLRPPKPERNPNYPTIPEISLSLIREFNAWHPDIKIRVIVADALYATTEFMDKTSEIYKKAQVISQIKHNQNVIFKGQKNTVEGYFKKHPGITQTIRIRGGVEVEATFSSARLHLNAHNKKRFIIALKYKGEEKYRYLVASDLTWRTMDIIQAYTMRWLVEVFIQDWKSYEGWDALTKQPGEEGTDRTLILSLLVDHCLFFHPDQLASIESKLPANTVGSLRETIKVDSWLMLFRNIVTRSDPENEIERISKFLKENLVKLKPSRKHMNHRLWENFLPAPSLKYRALG